MRASIDIRNPRIDAVNPVYGGGASIELWDADQPQFELNIIVPSDVSPDQAVVNFVTSVLKAAGITNFYLGEKETVHVEPVVAWFSDHGTSSEDEPEDFSLSDIDLIDLDEYPLDYVSF